MGMWVRCLLLSVKTILLVTITSCIARSVEAPPPNNDTAIYRVIPQTLDNKIDILFVIDNSASMKEEQENLRANFGAFIDNLRVPGTDQLPDVHIGVVTSDLGVYNFSHPDDNCDIYGGDQGLLRLPSSSYDESCNDEDDNSDNDCKEECPVALQPGKNWIEYRVNEETGEATTNVDIQGTAGLSDPIEQVKAAFRCMADVGTRGCGFEQHLEAAQWALAPDGIPSVVPPSSAAEPPIPEATKRIRQNPGFLRDNAFLAVVFLADEDDCSGNGPAMFSTAHTGGGNLEALSSDIGPRNSFRCFDLAVDCEGNTQSTPMEQRRRYQDVNPNSLGAPPVDGFYSAQPVTWEQCRPTETKKDSNGNWYVRPIEKYVGPDGFFATLKSSKDRVILFGIAGPVPENSSVNVKEYLGINDSPENAPDIAPSCQTNGQGVAAPAIRLQAAMRSFGRQGYFNQGVDEEGNSTDVNICSANYSTALKRLADVIVAKIGSPCLTKPLITSEGGMACSPGVFLGTDSNGVGRKCGAADNCLFNVDCAVSQVVGQTTREPQEQRIEKCDRTLFDDLSQKECNPCPCWRVHVPRNDDGDLLCDPDAAEEGSPYAIEILRNQDPEPGTAAKIICRTANSSESFFQLPYCRALY